MNRAVRWRRCAIVLWLYVLLGPGSPGIADPYGDIVALRKFNNELVTVHIPFPEAHPLTTHKQALEGDLAAFSPRCSQCVPGGPTHLHLSQGSGHAILSDSALSHLHANGTVLQTVILDQSCVPLYLQPSSIDMTVPFLVVCNASCYQAAKWDSHTIRLTGPEGCGPSGGVFVESRQELFLVTYSSGSVDEYSFSSGAISSPPLLDVRCEGAGDLYPLPRQEAYLLQCLTADGPALYVISLHGTRVRALPATGRPQSAPDGEHFIVIDGPSLRLYVTADQTVTPRAKTFSTNITRAEFMTSRYLSLCTAGGDHVLVNMQRIFNDSIPGEAIVALVGGRPLVTLWINPEVYAYIARDPNSALQMYFHNASSGKELEGGGEEGGGEVVDEPDLLVFMEKSVDTPPDDEVNGGMGSGLSGGGLIALVTIVGLLLVFVLLTVGLIVVGVAVYRRYQAHKGHSFSPLQGESSPDRPRTPDRSTPESPPDPPAADSPPAPQGATPLESQAEGEAGEREPDTGFASNMSDGEEGRPDPSSSGSNLDERGAEEMAKAVKKTRDDHDEEEAPPPLPEAPPSAGEEGRPDPSNSGPNLDERGAEEMEAVEETQDEPNEEETPPPSNFNEKVSVPLSASNNASFPGGYSEENFDPNLAKLV